MVSEALSAREVQVLEALVRAYVDLGTPVGSNTILRREGFDCSPATIRKALGTLEDKGYIQQPHTSAGRLPTTRGYRLYVQDTLEESPRLLVPHMVHLKSQLESKLREVRADEIQGQLAEIIGDVSHQLGLALAPQFEQGVLDSLELVRLAQSRQLLVATIQHGPVRSLVIEVSCTVSQRDLEGVARLLNERLDGLCLSEVRDTVRERVEDAVVGNPQLLRVVVDEIEAMAAPSADELHVAGASNICIQPEFRDSVEMAGLLDLMERKTELAHLLSEREGVVVTIGEENQAQEMRLFSLVTASYDVNGAIGVIGIMGPTRMPYDRAVALVNYAASRAADLVS